jgi:hypothetical protein
MKDRATHSTEKGQSKLPAANRVLMLMALRLDPPYIYSDYELQAAWRRRMSQVHPDHGGNPVVAAAVNMSYMALISRIEMPVPVDVLL